MRTADPDLADRATGSVPNQEALRLKGLREIASLVNAGSDPVTIFDHVVFAVCHHTRWSRSGIMAVDRTSGLSVQVTRYDPVPSDRNDLPDRWRLATSPSLRVVESKQPLVIEDAQHADDFPDYRDDAIARGYHTVVVLPLGCTDSQGRDMVLAVHSPERVKVEAEEIDFLSTVCHLAAIAVDKAKSLNAERLIASRLERTLNVNSRLLERVLAGSSMDTIAGIVETILPDPIAIVDLTTDSFYASRSPDTRRFSDPEWTELVEGPAAPHLVRLVRQAEPAGFRKRCAIDLSAVGIPFGHDAFVEPLQVDGETVGGLIIFPRQRALDELDYLIAQEAKFALSAQLMRTHIQDRRDAAMLTALVERLVEGAWSDPRQMRARAARLGVDLSGPADLVLIELVDYRTEESSSAVTGLSRALSRVVASVNEKAHLVELYGAWIVLLPGPTADAEVPSVRLAQQIVDAVKWQTGGSAIVTGASCERLEDYRTAFTHCRRLVTLARMFGRTGRVRQQDFGPFAVLLSAVDNSTVQNFLSATVGQVEVYDKKHGTEMLNTAAAFVDEGCRYQATANRLGIHVSTLRYRLKRLNDLFGLDIDDAETRFALALAFRLRQIGTTDGVGSREPGLR